MSDRIPIQPVVERLTVLRKVLTLREISEASGVGFHQLDAFQRKNRRTIDSGEAAAILALDPATVPERVPVRKSQMRAFSPEKFRALRLAQRFSMRALENSAGLANGQLHHWESGRNLPRAWRLEKVLAVLGCTFDDVSNAVESPAPDPVEVDEMSCELRPGWDDFILAPYPCGVCGERFRSRFMLATHPHGRRRK